MNTTCIRQGQTEFGIIEHDGREFVAFGATVNGRHITAYTRLVGRQIALTTWSGQTMLGCRSEIVEGYSDGSLALMFRLTRGRFVVGYALGDDGMLFRGELLDDCDDETARRTARRIADYFAEIDAEEDTPWEDDGE